MAHAKQRSPVRVRVRVRVRARVRVRVRIRVRVRVRVRDSPVSVAVRSESLPGLSSHARGPRPSRPPPRPHALWLGLG